MPCGNRERERQGPRVDQQAIKIDYGDWLRLFGAVKEAILCEQSTQSQAAFQNRCSRNPQLCLHRVVRELHLMGSQALILGRRTLIEMLQSLSRMIGAKQSSFCTGSRQVQKKIPSPHSDFPRRWVRGQERQFTSECRYRAQYSLGSTYNRGQLAMLLLK